jgi:hypothetical protein
LLLKEPSPFSRLNPAPPHPVRMKDWPLSRVNSIPHGLPPGWPIEAWLHSDSPPIQAAIEVLISYFVEKAERKLGIETKEKGVYTRGAGRVESDVDSSGSQAEKEAERSDDGRGVHFGRSFGIGIESVFGS